jgi:hypothetical protein
MPKTFFLIFFHQIPFLLLFSNVTEVTCGRSVLKVDKYFTVFSSFKLLYLWKQKLAFSFYYLILNDVKFLLHA